MGLPKRVLYNSPGETADVNIYDIKTKEIVFIGSQTDAAKFVGLKQPCSLFYYLRTKDRIKKKWAVRYVKDPQ